VPAGVVVRKAGDRSITETVIFAVAEARDVCANDLEPPLYAVTDGSGRVVVTTLADR